jgi:hypothetical protein
MPEIVPPAALRIAQESWSQSDGKTYQVSELTGKTRELQFGPAARWTCEGTIVPVKGEAAAAAIRAFQARMARPGGFVLLRPTAGQVSVVGRPLAAQVDGGPQLGRTLNLKGLAPGVINLLAGQFIDVVLGDDRQLLCLDEDLVAGTGGLGTASFSTPLRAAAVNNAAVQLHLPAAKMRIRNPMTFARSPGQIQSRAAIAFEEAF